MASPHQLLRTPALGSRSHPGPAGALCVTGAPHLPEIQILWQRAMPILYGLSERWQRTSPIVYGVSECHPLRQKCMQSSSTLMHGIQDATMTSTPALMHTTAPLHAGDVQLSGKARLIMEMHAVAACGAATKSAVAITMAPSSFQAH